MTIRVKCPACRQTLKAEERHAGRTVRCPACREPVAIPLAAEPAGASADDQLDPFADVAEVSVVESSPEPAKPPRPVKKPAPKTAETPPSTSPAVSEEEVGDWLTEGLPPSPGFADEIIQLPPQTPNWDGTSSTYDVADEPPSPPRKRRKNAK